MRIHEERAGDDNLRRSIRRDSHVAAGCGLAFALLVVTALIVYVLATA